MVAILGKPIIFLDFSGHFFLFLFFFFFIYFLAEWKSGSLYAVWTWMVSSVWLWRLLRLLATVSSVSCRSSVFTHLRMSVVDEGNHCLKRGCFALSLWSLMLSAWGVKDFVLVRSSFAICFHGTLQTYFQV